MALPCSRSRSAANLTAARNVRFSQFGKVCDDLLRRHSGSEILENVVDRDSCSREYGLVAPNTRANLNRILFAHTSNVLSALSALFFMTVWRQYRVRIFARKHKSDDRGTSTHFIPRTCSPRADRAYADEQASLFLKTFRHLIHCRNCSDPSFNPKVPRSRLGRPTGDFEDMTTVKPARRWSRGL